MNSGIHTIHYTQRQRKQCHTAPRNLMVPDSKGTHRTVALRIPLGKATLLSWTAQQ